MKTRESPLANVRRTVARHGLIRPGDKVLVAWSGGPDSTALLHLLMELRAEIHFEIAAAHFNHRLRPAADADAAFVRREAARLGIPFITARRDVRAFARARKLNLEEASRLLRYEFLWKAASRTGASRIATGHTRDDQAETVLIRLLRGSGPRGLSGIHPAVESRNEPSARHSPAACNHGRVRRNQIPGRSPGALPPGTIIRPLLGLSRGDILAYCRREKLSFRRDETNADPRYVRNRVRLRLIPYLERNFGPGLAASLGRTAEILREEDGYLETIAARTYARLAVQPESCRPALDVRRLAALPLALGRRCIRLFLRDLKGDLRKIEFEDIEALRELGRGKTVTLPDGLVVHRTGDILASPAKPSPQAPYVYLWDGRGRLPIPVAGAAFAGSRLKGKEGARPAYDDAGAVSCDLDALVFPLVVRTRRDGDRYRPCGAPGRKKLKEILRAKRIPAAERDVLPVFCSGDKIVWAPGIPVAEDFKVTAGTQRVFVIRKVGLPRPTGKSAG
jgi:tRNA(Ile)-lysidine synthase